MASHKIKGRQLSRDTEHRLALRRNMVQSLFEHGQIKTTLPKAQEVKGLAEKLITAAKLGTLTARRKVLSELNDRRLTDENQDFITEGNTKTVVQKLFNDVAPKFKGRNGGYTRIIKTPQYRIGDGGSVVILQLVSEESGPKGSVRRSAGLRKKRTEKRKTFAAKVLTGSKKAEA
jgi:large subunit ribosomal protein L17